MRRALCLLVFTLAVGQVVQGIPIQPVVLRGTHGTFESPGHPNEYANNLVREWRIEVRSGYRIKLRFTAFDLEDSYDEIPCAYDYVLLTEGGKDIGRFCGNSRQYPQDAPATNEWFYTVNNTLTVKFESDYSNEDISPRGFAAHYVEIDIDECAEMKQKEMYIVEDWDEFITCNHFCNNVPASYYCSCRSGFTLHSNQHTCVATFCEDQTLTADEGFVQSPEYPQPYAKLSHCTWNINVRDGLSVHLTFNREFVIEEHDEEGCAYDRLKITHSNREDSYCGKTAPRNGEVMDMNTKDVKIEFTTDLSVEEKGFRIFYNTTRIRCLTRLTDPNHGSITTSNPKGYWEFEDQVDFRCDRGYDLIGQQRLECLSDGSWSHLQPTCRIKSCGRPDHLISVKFSDVIDLEGKRFVYQDEVTVECHDWYEMTLGSATWMCEDSKQWERKSVLIAPNPPNDLPVCRPKCGLKGPEDTRLLHKLISGGKKSSRHEWPWMVFLNFGKRKDLATTRLICGGSLISPRYVLTAAHCLNSTDYPGQVRWANRTHVWLGVHGRDEKVETVRYVQAERIILHPLYYKSSIWNYDVGLIRLRETIMMGKNIRPVCLPSTKEEFDLASPGAFGQVAGWGLYDVGFKPSQSLMHAEFPIVSRAECWGSFQARSLVTNTTLPKDLKLTENMFCAGDEKGGQSTCRGDSGGAFVIKKDGSEVYYEVGLVSFGIGKACGSIISYSSYTKLNKPIIDWIMDNTNDLE